MARNEAGGFCRKAAGTLETSALKALTAAVIAPGADCGVTVARAASACVSAATAAGDAPAASSEELTWLIDATEPLVMSVPMADTAAGAIGRPVTGDRITLPLAKVRPAFATAPAAAADDPAFATPALPLLVPPEPMTIGQGAKAPPASAAGASPEISEPLPV